MKLKHALFAAFFTFMGLIWGSAATVTWDGGGGDLSWQNAANWSANTLPTLGDDVVINVPSNITVTSSANVTILSLQCSNNFALSGGTFRMRSGISIVQGQFTTTGNPLLSATGSLTAFSVIGPVAMDGANLEVINATMSFPGLTNYSKGGGCSSIFWTASGDGGELVFPNLKTLAGAACGNFVVQALNKGHVLFPSLTDPTEGFTTFLADGSGSLLDLPAATRSSGTTTRTVSFTAQNNGTIAMPLFTGGYNVDITVKTGGVLPVAQLTELNGFTVTGTNLDFPALTNLTFGSITVSAGAVVHATNILSHTTASGCLGRLWLVTGPGCVLDLPNLATMRGQACGYMNIQATVGGTVLLTNLTTVTEGVVNFLADGAGSEVDLSSLTQSLAATLQVSFEARNNGVIVMPNFPGGPQVNVSIKTGGFLPVTQLRELVGFTVTGTNLVFSALTNVTTGNITVNSGAVVTTPLLTNHSGSGCGGADWVVSGAGSVLDMSQLLSLNHSGCGNLGISATAGGTFIADNLTTVAEGTIVFTADGTNSVIDLSALVNSPGSVRVVTLDVRNAGTILAPLLPGGQNLFVSLQSGGSLPVAQLRQLRGFTVNGMNLNFPALTNISIGNLTASGGAMVSVPNLVNQIQPSACSTVIWQATGAGSVLDLPGLATLFGPGCGTLNLQALAGGVVQLGNLNTVLEGTVNYLADGTNSLVNLTVLTNVAATTRTVSFEARNAGTIAIPLLLGGSTVTVSIKSGGALDAEQMTLLKGLTVSGTTLVLPGLTDLFAGDITVSAGGVLRLPGLLNHIHPSSCATHTWLASDPSSVLDLSSLTNLAGPGCGTLVLKAQAGGGILLSNLLELTGGLINFISDGPNSLIDAAKLTKSSGAVLTASFEVRNTGAISIPTLTGGPSVSIIIKTNGTIPTAQLTQLGNITVSAANVSFPGLTNFDNGAVSVSAGGSVTIPNLVSYDRNAICTTPAWVVSNTNSVLDLPILGTLTGGSLCGRLDAQAQTGGHLLLGNLGNIPAGTVNFLASGGGSLIDLHSLSNFLNSPSLSQLTTTNGGTILLNEQPFFLSGVTANFAAGSPNLPQLNLGGTNLVLHGTAWHSYWTETRDTVSPANPWQFFQRIPLTNDFQVIAPRTPANQEFRGWEFVADPGWFELIVHPGLGVVPVLYGPTNHSFVVTTATNLNPPILWQPYATVSMTNTFRIFPLESAVTPQRFFQATPL